MFPAEFIAVPLFEMIYDCHFEMTAENMTFVSKGGNSRSASAVAAAEKSIMKFSSRELRNVNFGTEKDFGHEVFLKVDIDFLNIISVTGRFGDEKCVLRIFS